MPFNPNPIDAEQLRESIQLAGATDTIFLADGATYDSITTLAKIVCGLPTVREYGYTINGSNATVLNSRLFQQNIDGDLPAGQYTGGAQNLTLQYSSGGASDGGALLRANFADYTIDGVNFTGQHSGWTGQGNSGLYMSLTTFNYAAPINVGLTFSNSVINITGQGNFNPTLSSGEGGSAFLHSWNNAGTVTLDTNVFDESGYRSSFNFTNFSAPNSGPPTVGTYNITGSTFTRTEPTAQVTRSEGNRLGNVKATLTNNTFEKGSYLDLYDNISGVSFAGGENKFNTIAGGYGIRATHPTTGTVALQDGASIAFKGDGLALKYVSNVAGSFVLSAVGISAGMTVNGKGFAVLAAGSQVADTINITDQLWASGDSGNDTITSGNGNDYLDGGDDNDVLTSGFGADTLFGGLGNDILNSGGEADRLEGGAGNDSLNAGSGDDVLLGDAGNDTLVGGSGNDTLTGGAGSDQFRWASGDNTDLITDFTATGVDVDQMGLVNIFPLTTSGDTLNGGDFKTAGLITAMTNANNNKKVTKITTGITNISTTNTSTNVDGYVLAYNNTTGRGELWYDPNWINNSGRLQVATFDNVTSFATLNTFTNANFFAY